MQVEHENTEVNAEFKPVIVASAVTGAATREQIWREPADLHIRQRSRSSAFPVPAVSIRCLS